MSRGKPLAEPADLIFRYDGSLAGFYCCVHESIYTRALPADIQSEETFRPSLMDQVWVETDTEKALRVRDSVRGKISPRALKLIETVFLSCMSQKEAALLRFLLRAYRDPGLILALGDAGVAPLLKAERHYWNEQHLLLEFIRFSDCEGTLVATITPKNYVLPFLSDHFLDRFPEERFIILDKTYRMALVCGEGRRELLPVDHLELPAASEREADYQTLWKRFYDAVAIEARQNHRCRMTHCPKRYWENMTELRELL